MPSLCISATRNFRRTRKAFVQKGTCASDGTDERRRGRRAGGLAPRDHPMGLRNRTHRNSTGRGLDRGARRTTPKNSTFLVEVDRVVEVLAGLVTR